MWVDIAEVERRVRSIRIRERNEHGAIDSWITLLFSH